jgi:hypothetical protein
VVSMRGCSLEELRVGWGCPQEVHLRCAC